MAQPCSGHQRIHTGEQRWDVPNREKLSLPDLPQQTPEYPLPAGVSLLVASLLVNAKKS